MSEFTLTEISRETYGHDDSAINRHSERVFRAPGGKLYKLSKTLDGIPPFFEAYGPFSKEHQGILPRLQIQGLNYWGDGWSWNRAFQAFKRAVRRCELSHPEGKDQHENTQPTQPSSAG